MPPTGRWVLDPAGSRADFYVRHFWGLITVHGWFDRLSGAGTVAADGTMTGTVIIDATSVSSKNKQRDQHLRSADFFDVERHPRVVITVTEATADAAVLRAEITVDRTGFDMTWRPMKIASPMARATVVARFAREGQAAAS